MQIENRMVVGLDEALEKLYGDTPFDKATEWEIHQFVWDWMQDEFAEYIAERREDDPEADEDECIGDFITDNEDRIADKYNERIWNERWFG